MDRRRPLNPSVRPLVLIVEAHEDTRALYALALSMMGFDVVAAQDGTDGYLRAQENHPDIIVTDLSMPNCDGWQFLRELKASSHTRDIPVVAVSGHVQPSVRDRAERAGFAAFLPKPCRPDELAAELHYLLDRPRDAGATR
jgi:CheY-like chemotaxis protein